MIFKLIDLSHAITHHMPVHPYDDPVKLYQNRSLAADKYNNSRLEIGMHAGTHIDTPMHLTSRESFIDEMNIERFIGQGCLLDVRDEQIIGYKEKYREIVSRDDIVLLLTNHSEKYGTPEYFADHPVVDEALADFFIEKGIKMLGMDLPAPDRYPFPVHQKLFAKDILIIENMTNLSQLLSAQIFEVMAFPLKVRAEASIVRVVAKIRASGLLGLQQNCRGMAPLGE